VGEGRAHQRVISARTAAKIAAFGNYERIFDEGRNKVRAWEKANVPAGSATVGAGSE
jgi:hypothetical protein